jgi:hypothetical protein
MSETKSLEDMLLEAAETKRQREAAEAQKATITKADLAELFSQFETRIDAKIQKAMEQEDERGAGVGRKGMLLDERDRDPVAYLVAKAKKPETLTDEDKTLIGAITNQAFISLFPDNIKH